MVARLTPDQKVGCSSHLVVIKFYLLSKFLFFTSNVFLTHSRSCGTVAKFHLRLPLFVFQSSFVSSNFVNLLDRRRITRVPYVDL